MHIIFGQIEPCHPLVEALNFIIRELIINRAVGKFVLQWHVRQDSRIAAFPNTLAGRSRARCRDRTGQHKWLALAPASQPAIEFVEPSLETRSLDSSGVEGTEPISNLLIDRDSQFAELPLLVNRVDDLLGTERDQDAQDDDPNFAGKPTPPLKRCERSKLHVTSPSSEG